MGKVLQENLQKGQETRKGNNKIVLEEQEDLKTRELKKSASRIQFGMGRIKILLYYIFSILRQEEIL